jgi:exonuclease III
MRGLQVTNAATTRRSLHASTHRKALSGSDGHVADAHLLATTLMAALVSCEVLATDEWFAISDHAPIVADFRLTARVAAI